MEMRIESIKILSLNMHTSVVCLVSVIVEIVV